MGMPGEGQRGRGVIGATRTWTRPPETQWNVSPTLLDILGFPLSNEMPGRSLAGTAAEPRIATYGVRASSGPAPVLNDEYYENLKSLGYIK